MATNTQERVTELGRGDLGETIIGDTLVAKVAGLAARDARGVHALGTGISGSIRSIRPDTGAGSFGQSVRVEVGEAEVTADVSVVADYPISLQRVADAVRSAIVDAMAGIVGIDVTHVNVTVQDVFVGGGGAASGWRIA